MAAIRMFALATRTGAQTDIKCAPAWTSRCLVIRTACNIAIDTDDLKPMQSLL